MHDKLELLDQDPDITREYVVNHIKKSITGLKVAVTAEFIMQLIDGIDAEYPYDKLVKDCDNIRFELL